MGCEFSFDECGGNVLMRMDRYVWGDNVHKAKTQCESIDYILQLAVEMHKLGLPWTQ